MALAEHASLVGNALDARILTWRLTLSVDIEGPHEAAAKCQRRGVMRHPTRQRQPLFQLANSTFHGLILGK